MEDNSKGKSIAVPESNFTSDKLPLEVRVLVLEHDDGYLSTLETVLKSRGYGVIKCQQAKDALSLLVEDKSRYDVIISDAHLHDMDGLKLLLEKVGLEMGLPVVLILPEKKRVSILTGLLNGDCGYLIKPITSESLGQMLEQMSINKGNGLRVLVVGDAESQEITDTIPPRDHELQENFPATSNEADATYKRVKTEKDHDYASYDVTKAKKPRLVWTAELHNKFDMAVKQLLPKNAVPKKILECMQNMGVTNLTRENVASHLQKYRIHRKRDHEGRRKALDDLQRTSVEQSHASDGMFESIQAYTGPDQLPFPSLALDSNSNHEAPDLPNHANINPLDSSVQAMVSSHKKLMANQLSDHNDGTVLVYNNWTVPAMQPNLQTNETPAQFFGINTNITDRQYCQPSEAGPSGQIMIDGAENIGNWSFDFSECENINVADTVNCSVENNAAVLEYLRVSRQYNGIPDLQTTSSDRMNSNSTIYGNNNSFVAGPVAGEEYYVNYGINAPYCNDIHVDGNAYNSYQNLVQPEQRYDGNDFMQKQFIQQSGSGLAKTK